MDVDVLEAAARRLREEADRITAEIAVHKAALADLTLRLPLVTDGLDGVLRLIEMESDREDPDEPGTPETAPPAVSPPSSPPEAVYRDPDEAPAPTGNAMFDEAMATPPVPIRDQTPDEKVAAAARADARLPPPTEEERTAGRRLAEMRHGRDPDNVVDAVAGPDDCPDARRPGLCGTSLQYTYGCRKDRCTIADRLRSRHIIGTQIQVTPEQVAAEIARAPIKRRGERHARPRTGYNPRPPEPAPIVLPEEPSVVIGDFGPGLAAADTIEDVIAAAGIPVRGGPIHRLADQTNRMLPGGPSYSAWCECGRCFTGSTSAEAREALRDHVDEEAAA